MRSQPQIFTMKIIDGSDLVASRARDLIAHSFQTRLGAYPNVNHRHYLIVEAKTDSGVMLAACSSISFAHEQNLFSETYLSQPIQREIVGQLDIDVNRSAICEIGSLSIDPNFIPSVRRVVAYFPWFAHRLGYDFALVTVTSYMRIAFIHSGTNFKPLCDADPGKLSPEDRARWGSYYEYAPQTGIIDLNRMSFLDQIAAPSVREVVIKLGCFGKVVA
jgi:hypothetical protein